MITDWTVGDMDPQVRCPNCRTMVPVASRVGDTTVACPTCGVAVPVPGTGLKPGSLLGGFLLKEKLGQGGMGQVFRATQLSMQRDVAVKILPPEVTSDPEFIERFRHEVRITAQLNHPNVVTAYEAGEEGGIHYLAMAYIEGESLDHRVQRKGALSEKEALRIIRAVAEALAYAWNKHRMLHRDIKPANIMLTGEGDVKLMDMGLSRGMAENTGMTLTGTVVGTPNYMSPEQARGESDLDHRADIYSLGATLYQLLTGRVPFRGDSVAEVLSKVLRDDVHPVRSLAPGISPACERFLERALAKDRDDRQPTWQALIEELDAMASRPVVPVGVKPATRLHPARPASVKKPPPRLAWRLIAGIAAVFVLLGVAGILLVRSRRHRQDRVQVETNNSAPGLPAASPSRSSDKLADTSVRVAAKASTAKRKTDKTAVNWSAIGAALQAANPRVTTLAFQHASDDDGLRIDLSGNAGLADIKALADHPVVALHLQKTAVTDLSPLHGMVLAELSLADTPVSDLSPLEGMPLRTLDLSRTKVTDLAALAGMPLDTLLLGGTPVRDLSVLATLPLKRLDLGGCEAVKSLTPVAGIKTLSDLVLPRLSLEATVLRSLPALTWVRIGGDDANRLSATEFRKQVDALAAEEESRRQQLEKAVNQAFEAVAKQLLAGNIKAAGNALATLGDDPNMAAFEDDITTALETVGSTSHLPDLVYGSFKKDIGNVVTIDFRSGKQQARITTVEAHRVLAEFPILGNKVVKRPFAFNDLSPKEMRKRLGQGDAPDILLMRGLLYAREKKPDSAGGCFERIGGRLGQALLRAVDGQPGGDPEEMARLALRRILRNAGFPDASLTGEALNVAVETQVRGGRIPAETEANLVEFWFRHGGTHVAIDNEKALETLLLVAMRQRLGSGEAALDAFVAANPSLTDAWKKEAHHDVGVAQMTFDRLGIPLDLHLIANIPLLRLNVGGTMVHDLTPLKGMRLRVFYLYATPVSDLSPLKGMPLKSLALNETPVVDLEPLHGMPLRILNLCGAGGIKDLRPLHGMPLESLNLDHTSVGDLSPLHGMPLRSLILSSAKGVKDLRSLSGMPLNVFAARDTPIDSRDLRALRGMPLSALELGYTQVRSLRYLRGLPLTKLQLEASRVSNLEPLRGMHLTFLSVAGQKDLTDLSPLQGMPLQYLDLRSTGVRDLKSLSKCPLLYLRLDGCSGLSIRDLEVLRRCKTLRLLALPDPRQAKPDFLRRMPNLKSTTLGDAAWKKAEVALPASCRWQ